MSQKTRTILFYIFVFLFFILTPTISFYASGYKLGSGMNLEKTGILIVDTEPESASIYINGEIQQDFVSKMLKANKGYLTTPQKIKNLLPGEYTIKMEKDGYWPWEKRLAIKPGESTFAEDVVLFKKSLPILVNGANSNNNQILSDKNNIIYINDENLVVSKDENIFSQKLAQKISVPGLLSPEKNKIITGNYIYNLYENNSTPLSLDKLLGSKAQNVQWGENDNEILFLNNGSLYLFNISNNQTASINSSKNSQAYLVKKGYIYNIANNATGSELEVIESSKNEIIKKISLPNSEYAFLNIDNELINLFDAEHQILYLVNPLAPFKPLQETITGIKYSFWLNDSIMIYANDFEIWSYDARSSQKTLLTRISQPIKSVMAHPDENYIIFSTGNDINILELDDREHYNITKILEIEKLENLKINKDGNAIYFSAKIGNQEGLFKLEI